MRRALIVGVTEFDDHERLDFAPARVWDLEKALHALGYTVEAQCADRMTSAELGAAIAEAVARAAADDLMLVHVLSHGHQADGNATVFALGSDGKPHASTSVAHWLTMQQNAPERPRVLFLLDLCSAGTATRLQWQGELENAPRSWVIAACPGGQAAYDGRFTEAVVAVLRGLHEGELDVDRSSPHVPLPSVARAIRQEVNRLADADDALPQQVKATVVDISEGDYPPFFPNRDHDPSPRPALRASVDPGVLPFLDDLDEGLDARHFLERATGTGRLTSVEHDLAGCFTGRGKELRELSPWVNGVGDAVLRVVTGSPGSGKSALLGVLVCAAHPQLRERTQAVWNNIVQAPTPVAGLAAVHARQRGLAAVTTSLARQLGLPEAITVGNLVAELRQRQAVIVVDALDEADNPVTLMTELLLPLAAAGARVRLLVGVRDYPEYRSLLDLAVVVNLDDVDRGVLEDDLYNYVSNLMRTVVEYRRLPSVTGEFAHAVAETLAFADSAWGPFLVAGLYTRHFLSAYAEVPLKDPEVAKRLGSRAPAELQGVLELDLELAGNGIWLNAMLTALAHAKGSGMPVSVLARVTSGLVPKQQNRTPGQIRSMLEVIRFYLRQSMDPDHSNLYRLFHQGLAETLAGRTPNAEHQVLDALLHPLGQQDNRDWNAAEPYLFRHVASHAEAADRLEELSSDPGLLLHPGALEALTEAAGNSDAAASITSTFSRYTGIKTPEALALEATRAGDHVLARRAANMAGRQPLIWQPRWAAGGSKPKKTVPWRFFSIAMSEDGTKAAALSDTSLITWILGDDWVVMDKVFTGVVGDLVLLSERNEAVVFSAEGAWREDGARVASPGKHAIAAAVQSEPNTYFCVSEIGEIISYHFTSRRSRIQKRLKHRSRTWTMGVSKRNPIAFSTTSDGTLFTSGKELPEPPHKLTGPVVVKKQGSHVVAAFDAGFTMLELNEQNAEWRTIHTRTDLPTTALAIANGSNRVLTGRADGSVRTLPSGWFPLSNKPITRLTGSARAAQVIGLDSAGGIHCYDHMQDRMQALPLPPRTLASSVSAFTLFNEKVILARADLQLVEVSTKNWQEIKLGHLPATATKLSVEKAGDTDLLIAKTGSRTFSMHRDSGERLNSAGWFAARFRPEGVDHGLVDGWLVELAIVAGHLVIRHSNDFQNVKIEIGAHESARAVRCATLEGRSIAFSGCDTGLVRWWDLEARALLGEFSVGAPIWQIDTMHDGRTLLIGAGGELLVFEHHGSKS
ncbi:hypothetical protein GCM10010428_72400 [Actinosynnema pretiosum subsp. pretiosum]